jgi:predicted DCC family thiol-disulfide oxidoreductase YuxK
MIRSLYVFYDADCGLCSHFKRWLQSEPAWIQLNFIPLQSPMVAERFPELTSMKLEDEITVVSDERGIYRGSKAWIMCLYALVNYRELSLKLARPALLPIAHKVCRMVAARRHKLSDLLGLPEEKILKDFAKP